MIINIKNKLTGYKFWAINLINIAQKNYTKKHIKIVL